LKIKKYDTGDTVDERKLYEYLSEYRIKMGNVRAQDANGHNLRLSQSCIENATKSVVDLWREQSHYGTNNNPNPRGSVVSNLIKQYETNEANRQREDYVDRGRHTVKDRYTAEELLALSKFWIEQDTVVGLRNRTMFLTARATLSRCQSSLMIQLPDMLLADFENEGPTPCKVLVISMTKSKSNTTARVEYGAAMRHLDVHICPVGSVALYFFARFHLQEEAFPEFTTREHW
jgi:hypothetical protein